jgi:hypothetical protein
VRFEDLVADMIKIIVTCDMRPCSLVARYCTNVSPKPDAYFLRIA